MKTLVIGAGEVGSSLKKILSNYHETYIRDIDPLNVDVGQIDCLQICYPDSSRFIEITRSYIEEYNPSLVIINSSVSVGTTRRCGDDVVYSPIRGRHPDQGLDKEMRVFPKFVSSLSVRHMQKAVQYFKECEWTVIECDNPDSLEFFKVMSNVHMGLEIAWRQEIERMMKQFEIDPIIYNAWERTYNEGYQKLGQYHLMRPIMRPDPIGGHCILPCTDILRNQFPSRALEFILESNRMAKYGR